jgi:membrane protease YdiL (CAAX protease family)
MSAPDPLDVPPTLEGEKGATGPEEPSSSVQGAEVLQAFFLFFLLSFAVATLSKYLFQGEESKAIPWQLAALQVPIHLLIAFAIFRLRLFCGGRSGLQALGWTESPSPFQGFTKGILWYLPMGFSWWTLAILYMMGLKALGIDPPKQEVIEFFLRPDIPIYGVAFLWITTCLTAPLAEELLFRGSLFSWLRKKFSFWPAALLTALAFALPHGGWKFIIPLGYLALMLAWLREKSGSIWLAMGLHAAHNFTTLLIISLNR